MRSHLLVASQLGRDSVTPRVDPASAAHTYPWAKAHRSYYSLRSQWDCLVVDVFCIRLHTCEQDTTPWYVILSARRSREILIGNILGL